MDRGERFAWGEALASSARAVVLACFVGGAAAAEGDVRVLFDRGSGDLLILGDEEDNWLMLLELLDTEGLTIRGVGGTTVNGQPEIRLAVPARVVLDMGDGDDTVQFARFDVGNCCAFPVVFRGGAGDDFFRVGDEQAWLEAVDADLGPGNDRFWAGEGGGVGELKLVCGEGDDVVDGFYSYMRAGANVDLGPGDDRVDFRAHAMRGTFSIKAGPGADSIVFEDTYLRMSLMIGAGEGDDLIEITDGLFTDGGVVLVDGEEGVDRILVGGELNVANGVSVYAGAGPDVVEVAGVRAGQPFAVSLGPGDDRLLVGGSAFESETPTVFDGAEGVDRYLDFGGNRFDSVPDTRHFEVPKASRDEAATPDVSTTLAGRIVEPNGRPVAGAIVHVPALGLTTSSADDGGFRFDELTFPFTRLELHAGATVRGRRMGTIELVVPVADSTTELGDVVLAPTRALSLLFGDDPYTIAPFKDVLRALGDDPRDLVVSRFLPEDLSSFETVWHLGRYTPLIEYEEERLKSFVRSGGGLYLSTSYYTSQSLLALVDQMLLDPEVTIDSYGPDPWIPFEYNPGATGGLTRMPNLLAGSAYTAAGSVTLVGVEPENAFAWNALGKVHSAAWSSLDLRGGKGRLCFALRSQWLTSPVNLAAVENLRTFLRWEPDGFVVR